MEQKLLDFLKQQRDLAMQRNKTHILSEYNKKITLLEDYITAKEQGVPVPLPYEFIHKTFTEHLSDEILNQDIELFTEGCTLGEFIAWFNDTLPEVFQNNVLKIYFSDKQVTYNELTFEQLSDLKVGLDPCYRTLFVYNTKNGVWYQGSLFMENIDLYKICTSNTKEYLDKCENNAPDIFETNY